MIRVVFFLLLCFQLKGGVAGYTNVGNGNTKFSGTEGGTISVQTGAATAFDAIIRSTSYDDFEWTSGSATANETGSAGKGGMIFRYTNSSNYYAVTVHWDRWATGKYIVRLKDSNLSGYNSTGDIASYSNSGAITALVIKAEGTSIQVTINGTLRIDVTDSNHSSGSIGFAHHTLWNWESVSWSGVSVAEVLPVQLLQFQAEYWEKMVKLEWTTGMEVNNDYFDIQKSINGLDWYSIGTVLGNGTTTNATDYQFLDTDGCEGSCYYRLNQYDYDGEQEFHGPLIVNRNENIISFDIFPNSVKDLSRLRISSNEDSFGLLVLTDASGRQVYHKAIAIQKGQVEYLLSGFLDIPPGVYMVSIFFENDHAISEKLIFQ